MSYVKDISLFVSGAALGSAFTYIFLKNKYSKIAQEEIDSVKSVFAKKEAEKKEKISEEVTVSASVTPTKSYFAQEEYEMFLKKTNDYNDSSDVELAEAVMPIPSSQKEKSYIIPPEDFGEFEDYEQITLIFNKNNMALLDELGDLVDDPDNTVGRDFLYHFGEYEDDSVYVRNDKTKCDYEILLDN